MKRLALACFGIALAAAARGMDGAGVLALLAAPSASASPVLVPLATIYPELDAFYIDLHRNPELGYQEVRSAGKIAEKLRALGYEVTTGVGKTGVVGVLKNGKGPTVLLRGDMDALPVKETTGLPYASTATSTDDGETVPVMHACGHDVHMTALVGAATLLAKAKNRWRGTLLIVAQPAEEGGSGAKAMLRDGFLERFGRPDFALSLHDMPSLAAGTVAVTPGYAMANSDSVDITFYGRGGHGSMPQATVDPIVIAARFVTAVQTIISRETDPREPAVVTVGSIHGGTRRNIIPNEVELKLTVRSFKPEVRAKLLAGISRIAKAEAAAAGAPEEPRIVVSPTGYSATYNDPWLARQVTAAFEAAFGKANVVDLPPVLGSEDFGDFGRAAGAPSLMFWVGGSPPEKHAAAAGDLTKLPSLHSSAWAPDREPTLKTATAALTAAAMAVLAKP
jgi:hippurate hydrolase